MADAQRIKPSRPPLDQHAVYEEYANGSSLKAIAEKHGYGAATVRRALTRERAARAVVRQTQEQLQLGPDALMSSVQAIRAREWQEEMGYLQRITIILTDVRQRLGEAAEERIIMYLTAGLKK